MEEWVTQVNTGKTKGRVVCSQYSLNFMSFTLYFWTELPSDCLNTGTYFSLNTCWQWYRI